MKALVIGASGQVGRYLLREFRSWMNTVGTYYAHPEEGLCRLDITDQAECERLLYEEHPTCILLPGAVTHVDWCEDNPEQCYRVNVAGVRNVSATARDLGSRLLLFSTDQVFSESDLAYREEDPVSPLNVYARSKVLAEQVVRELLPGSHLIIRTGWVYGLERQGKNFVLALCRRILQGESVAVPEDQWGSPTYAYDLARATLTLVRQRACGTYHMVGPEWMTRYRFAQEVCRAFGFTKETVRPVSTEVLGQRAPRPRKCRLDTSKFQKAVSLHMRIPQEGLQHMQEDRL
jgi:dTDP-4-dehydrorhamnose reductase